MVKQNRHQHQERQLGLEQNPILQLWYGAAELNLAVVPAWACWGVLLVLHRKRKQKTRDHSLAPSLPGADLSSVCCRGQVGSARAEDGVGVTSSGVWATGAPSSERRVW